MNRQKSDPAKNYKTAQIKTASQGRLIIMLYDGAITFITTAINAVHEKKIEQIHHNITRAQDIITELMTSLNFESGGKIAQDLLSIYIFINKQLIEANIKKTDAPLHEALSLLRGLKESWEKISETESAARNFGRSDTESGINLAG